MFMHDVWCASTFSSTLGVSSVQEVTSYLIFMSATFFTASVEALSWDSKEPWAGRSESTRKCSHEDILQKHPCSGNLEYSIFLFKMKSPVGMS